MTDVDFDEGEIEQDFGKLPLRSDPKLLRGKNYEVFSDGDSIGLDEITDDYDCQDFDPETLSHWKTPNNCEKLAADNLNKVLQPNLPLVRLNQQDVQTKSPPAVEVQVKSEEISKNIPLPQKMSSKQEMAQPESFS